MRLQRCIDWLRSLDDARLIGVLLTATFVVGIPMALLAWVEPAPAPGPGPRFISTMPFAGQRFVGVLLVPAIETAVFQWFTRCAMRSRWASAP